MPSGHHFITGVRRRWLRWLALGMLGLLAAGYGGWIGHRPSRLTDAQTGTVLRGDIEETVTALGKVQPRDYVDVGAQASGQLKQILAQPGERVRAGQLLAEIDPQIESAKVDVDDAALQQLAAQLTDSQAELAYAQGEFRRQNQLRRSDATRDDTFEQARRDMIVAGARVDEIQAQIRQAQSTLRADQAQLGYTRIYAPMAGVVVSVNARAGQTINAAYTAPVLMRIADLSTMTVWTQVSEADVPQLKVGMPLYFTTLGYPGRRWTAKLRQILPAPPKPQTDGSNPDATTNTTGQAASATNNVVLYTALFDVSNEKGDLRPEMTAQVFFVTASANDAVLAPRAALTPVEGSPGEFAVDVIGPAGKIETRHVRIGVATRFTAQILSGLRPGERVITGHMAGTAQNSLIGFRL